MGHVPTNKVSDALNLRLEASILMQWSPSSWIAVRRTPIAARAQPDGDWRSTPCDLAANMTYPKAELCKK